MPGITGQGTTFALPNFVGELFAVTPTDTPFLSSIGGLTGGRPAEAILFQWQGYDLRSASANRQRVEGATAPTAEQRVRFNVHNVCEIHQEAVELTYTKMAATGQYASTGSTHPNAVGITGVNPVADEQAWQVEQHLIQIARDTERSFIVGKFSNPGTNATARRTRGIVEATTTNVSDEGTLVGTAAIESDTEVWTDAAHGLTAGDAIVVRNITGGAVDVIGEEDLLYVLTVPDINTYTVARKPSGATVTFDTDGGADVYTAALLDEDMVLNLLQDVWENGGIQVSETATLMANGSLKRKLTDIFITAKNFREMSRDVGGVHVMMIETDFGTLNVMLNRHMPTGALQVVSLEQCAPRFLEIPGKGFLFEEELARVGASERRQIYGEVGLEYGNEKAHGKLLGLSPTA